MTPRRQPLDVIRIEKPCPASWEQMRGDAQVRFCEACRLNVYNLSEMPREQAEALISGREGRLCVRYYQRSDGGVITQDCKGGLRRRVMRAAGLAASASIALLATALSAAGMSTSATRCKDAPQTPDTREGWLRLFGSEPAPVVNHEMMGKVSAAPVIVPQQAPAKLGEMPARDIMGAVAVPPASQPTTQPADAP